jgi:hypothetical protein
MDWFMVKIVYEIICGEGDHMAQFDEQLRLINAANEKEAFQKANMIGEAEAVCFPNIKSELVQWNFMGVTEILAIADFSHGAEIWSRIREEDQADYYRNQILTRTGYLAQNLQTCHPSPFLTLP